MPSARNNGAGNVAIAEAKVIASRILAREPVQRRSDDSGGLINWQKFNTLLADAQKIADFVLNNEPVAG